MKKQKINFFYFISCKRQYFSTLIWDQAYQPIFIKLLQYSPDNLIFTFFSNAKQQYDNFRDEVKKAGFPGIHYQLFVYGEFKEHESKLVDYLGINSLSQYGWYRFKESDYIKFGEKTIELRNEWDKHANVPYFPLVQVGWDDTRNNKSGKNKYSIKKI